MSVNNVSNSMASYSATDAYKAAKGKDKDSEVPAKKEESGVVYEKSNIDKDSIIAQLKADAEQRTSQLRSLVEDMMKKQGQHIGKADSMWKFLASGNYTVTAEAKAQAQASISEDGYWGVKQTSDRILEFAKALTGGDPSKAEGMRAAFEKGFKSATKAWGKELPGISKDTYDAVMKKFDEWAGKTETKTDTEA